jgi:hypothetical protein
VFGLTVSLFSEAGGNSRGGLRTMRIAEETSRFIVAFEMSPEHGFNFTWPPESMQPAPYKTVLMVVEKMPKARAENNANTEFKPLIASHHLKINGRPQKPYRVVRGQVGGQCEQKQIFLVKLNQGRLRLSLSIPPGLTLDNVQNTVSIRLYLDTENK